MMELTFDKVTIPCLRHIFCETGDHEETLEIRIRDDMPDIDKVIGCWGQPVIRGKEWRNNGICINGGVMLKIAYQSEENYELQCMDAWLPYQFKRDFSEYEEDGELTAYPLLHTLDARVVSARKIMVRAVIGLFYEAAVNGKVELFKPTGLPDDIQLLKSNKCLMLPRLMGEKTFRVEERFSISGSDDAISKVLYCQVSPNIVEQKVMCDKVVFRGILSMHLLYMNDSGQILSYDAECSFSQFAELVEEFSSAANLKMMVAVSTVDLEKTEDGSFKLTAGLIGQYLITDQSEIEYLEDAYSPMRNIKPGKSCFQTLSIINSDNVKIGVQCELADSGFQVVDATFYPAHPKQYMDEGIPVTEFAGEFNILGYDDNGQLVPKTIRWNMTKNSELYNGCNVTTCVPISVCPQISSVGSNYVLSLDLPVTSSVGQEKEVAVVNGLLIDESVHLNDDRPSMILRKCGSDNLWTVAKDCGSTIDRIIEANKCNESPCADQYLIVPVL